MSDASTPSVEEILKPLRTHKLGAPFPEAAVREAVARREEVTPALLKEFADAAARVPEIGEEEMLHLYAMHLLAQFREERSLPLFLQFFSWPEDDVDAAAGDTVTEGLSRMLASVCGKDVRPIQELIENRKISEWVRSAGIEALAIRCAFGLLPHEELVAYYRSLFEGKLEREPLFTWEALVGACGDLHLDELVDQARKEIKGDLMPYESIELKEFEKTFAQPAEQVIEEFRERAPLITDTVEEMAWWHCFQPEALEDELEMDDEGMDWDLDLPRPGTEPVIAPPKIGRNDLCPCGSGKKYKKCCGAVA